MKNYLYLIDSHSLNIILIACIIELWERSNITQLF